MSELGQPGPLSVFGRPVPDVTGEHWMIAVRVSDGTFAGSGLWGSIVESLPDGKVGSPWEFHSRTVGRLPEEYTLREPRNARERKAVGATARGGWR